MMRDVIGLQRLKNEITQSQVCFIICIILNGFVAPCLQAVGRDTQPVWRRA